jgi:hypothetical protein
MNRTAKGIVRWGLIIGFFAFCVYAYRDTQSRRINSYEATNAELNRQNQGLTKQIEALKATPQSAATQPADTQPAATE